MSDEHELEGVHERAMARFDRTVPPQIEIRRQSLTARRFISIPGAMWEGEWGEQFENSIRVEVPKVKRGLRKIRTDYRQNRIIPDFRPDGPVSDEDTADMLDGLHRADSYHHKAQQARDNAFDEASAGGFGAYRLSNTLEDELDPENERQRINPGMTIVDADQTVFFDPDSLLYDKSDAKFCIVLSGMSPERFAELYSEKQSSWPEGIDRPQNYDWFQPETTIVAEYYEVSEQEAVELVCTHNLTDEETCLFADEVDAAERVAMEEQGWLIREKKRKRRIVTKYVLSGAEVLKEGTVIAGENIPIVPVYGEREYVDKQERFQGYVQDRMDSQRLYNAKVSKLAETDALAPREIPIFAAEQMPPHLADQWRRQNIDRHPYALVEPLRDDATGQIISAGPIGKVSPPQMPPVTGTLLQIANQDLLEDDLDGADEVKANVSAEAMEIAATRVDEKSGIYLDNMRQSVQREAEIYLAMARDVYFEPGRLVETMDEDGGDGRSKLREPIIDATGVFRYRHDLQRGRYKVVASVTEATATRRDKTVKAALRVAEVSLNAGDQELGGASLLTAISNMDGEGMDSLREFARRKGVSIGLFEPNEEEKRSMEQEAENQQPDPTQAVLQEEAGRIASERELNTAKAGETMADAEYKKAKTVETMVEIDNKKKSGALERMKSLFEAMDGGPVG